MKTIEEQVSNTITEALHEAVKAKLASGYHDSPLNKMIDSVVVSRLPELRAIIEEAIDAGLKGSLKKELQEAIKHKLARVLVSKMEGEFESQANDLRSNPETRARIVLAVSNVLKTATA